MTTVRSGVGHAGVVDDAKPRWHEVDEGFWVGSTSGAFLGTIERQGATRFFARDARRRYTGEYPSLRLAQSAIADLNG